jgi:hypothetical protein
MKKLAVLSLMLGMGVLLAAGCATTAKGPTDEELVAKRIGEGIAAVKAKNWGAFDGMVSNAFESGAVGNKEDLVDYLKNADGSGFLDGLEIDLSEAKTVVTGEKATVGPVTASGGFGSLTLYFEGAKEKGVWMITNVEP